MKILAFDTETTGLDPSLHSIIQLSAVFIRDGEPIDSINLFMQPFSFLNISPEALQVHNITLDQLQSFPDWRAQFQAWEAWLAKYIDRFNKRDKAYPLAYRGTFDLEFLSALYKRCDNPYLGSWINWRLLDPLPLLNLLHYRNDPTISALDNLKLSTVAAALGIELQAHDAKSDIIAAVEVWKWAQDRVKE